MRSFIQRLALTAGAVLAALGTAPASASAQKALVYCPVTIDATGCNAIAAALAGSHPLGVDRGYDGTNGTVDLKTVDLFTYSVFVVPSLADNATAQPYAKLREPEVAERLRAALIGRIAMWSGSPDQGATNRGMKDALIQNLASYAGGAFATARGPGLVTLLDASSSNPARYDWVRGITPVPVSADAGLLIYNTVRALNPTATMILTSGAGPIAYTNMATYGFAVPTGAAGVSLDAVGQTGTTIGGQVVLLTSPSINGGTAKVWTDKDDYAPHEATWFTGSGWRPGETIRLTLTEDPEIHDELSFTAVADSLGNFEFDGFRPDDHDAGVRFVLTAVGQSSGLRAQTTFTDAITVGPVATNNSGGGPNSQELTINAPSVSANDVMVAHIVITDGISNTFICAPAGWTSIHRNANTPTNTVLQETFWFRANAAAAATSHTWQFRTTSCGGALIAQNTKGASGGITRFSGVTTSGSPVDVVAGNAGTSSGPFNAPSVSTTTANALVLRFFGVFKNTNITHASTPRLYHTSSNTQKERAAAAFNSGVLAIPGATGTLTATLASTAEFVAQTVALKEACTPPSITTNPTNQAITYGNDATFTVAGAGAPAPTVQWQLSTNSGGTWNNVPGATNATLTVIKPAVSQSGHQYRAVLTNGCGTATSTVATLTVTAKALTVAGITANNKQYDGTTAATLNTAGATLVGVVSPDAVTLVTTGAAGTFATATVGTGKIVQVSGLTITGAAAGNYTLTQPTATADITPKQLTGSFTAADKQYDGTTAAAITSRSVAGKVGTEDVSLVGGTATFDTKHVGTNKVVTGTGFTLAGADAANYVLAATTLIANADVSPRALVVSATGQNKEYDGTTAATVTLADDRVAGDNITTSYTAAAFADKHVGIAKPVSVTGVAIIGPDAGNYTFNTTCATTADITAKSVTGSFTADSKVYDGNATANISARNLMGTIAGDVVSLTGGTATFDSKHVGTGKTVTGIGFSLTGADATNYSLVSSTLTTTANITARALLITATGVNKVYDGNTTATVTLADDRVGGDTFTDSYTTATFADKNVANGKSISVSGISISGPDAGNYTFNTTAIATANVTARALVISAIGQNKVYDATTDATVTLSDDRVTGDVATAAYTDADFNNKHVGNAKPISVSGISLTGTDAGNYTFNTTANAIANITARGLLVTATGVDKVYDGTTAATVTLADDRISGDVFTDNYTAATFDTKHVGAGKTVSVSGISLSGADAGNYTPNTTATTSAEITARALVVTATGVNKVYDATTAATVTLADNRVAGDVFTDNYTTATFDTKNVGAIKTISVSGISITGSDAANYAANTTATATANITAAQLVGSFTADDKVYDGNMTATIATRALAGVLLTDVVSLTDGNATFDTKNVGAGKTVTGAGFTLGGGDAGNYLLASTTITTTAAITQRTLVVTATGVSRVYNATTVATVTLSDNRVSGDVFTDSYTAASFADKNVGTAKPVSVTGISITGTDAGNYTANATAATTADITPFTLTGSFTASDKIYDGTDAATIATRSVAVVFAGDNVQLDGGTATFVNKNVGTAKTVNGVGFALIGGDAPNYVLASTSLATTADITPRALTVAATGINKVYDGSDAASVTLADNRVSGDVFTTSHTTATFNNKNVGSAKPISVSGISISGTDAGNYTFNATAATTADITPRALAVTATGVNKVYDATTAATVTLSDDRVAGDVFTTAYTTVTFADKNVGTGKTVSVSGISITGTDAGNYTFNTLTSTTADITARPLVVTATGINKVYDGTTAATVTLADDRLAGDVFTASYAAAFDNKNAGTAKPVSVSGISLSGTDADNYAPNTSTSTTADITQRALVITATGVNRVYDATTNATVTLADNRVTGDVFTDSYTTASFVDKHVGLNKPVSVSGISISGTDGPNYTFNTTASTTANITAKALVVSAAGIDKVYDGSTTATVNLSDDRVAGDNLSLAYASAAFDDKTVGTNKPVSVSAISATGADAGNYAFNTTAATTASITARPLVVTAAGIDKVYDGNTTAAVTLSDNRVAGDVFTDSYTTATFNDANVGVAKPVSVGGIAITGTDAANYTFNTTTSTTASITARPVAVTADAKTKVYGHPDPALTYQITAGSLASGDAFGGTLARVAGENVGTYTITQGSLALSANYALTYVGANLTIAKADQAITFAAPVTPAAFGTSFAVNPTVGSPPPTPPSGLAVGIAVSGVCTLAGNTVTMTGTVGTCTIIASQGGNDNYNAAPNVAHVVNAFGAFFLALDPDAIAKGQAPNNFTDADVNEGIAAIGQRTQLSWFAKNGGRTIDLPSGQVGDEAWMALKTIPSTWVSAGPTTDGARNLLRAGPGLGSGATKEAYLDKVPDVTPLRATGLNQLIGQKVCAIVWKSDISLNIAYPRLDGSLKGDNRGIVAFEVLDVVRSGSGSTLPRVRIKVVDAGSAGGATGACNEPLVLHRTAPAPISSSAPMDVQP